MLDKFQDMSDKGETICCVYTLMRNPYNISETLTGFSRMIYYTIEEPWIKTEGVFKLTEGHFTNGIQDGFGRMISKDPKRQNDIAYTGWFPSSERPG